MNEIENAFEEIEGILSNTEFQLYSEGYEDGFNDGKTVGYKSRVKHCRWEKKSLNKGTADQCKIYETCSGNYIWPLRDFVYCPYCGGKIKVVEK